MKLKNAAGLIALGGTLCLPLAGVAQYGDRNQAQYEQERSDAHHHTKAKIVGGSAVGGAVVGGLMGGGKGALIGAGVGAGGGLVANHVRKQHDIHQRERRDAAYRRRHHSTYSNGY